MASRQEVLAALNKLERAGDTVERLRKEVLAATATRDRAETLLQIAQGELDAGEAEFDRLLAEAKSAVGTARAPIPTLTEVVP